jgi:hypothetical protein
VASLWTLFLLISVCILFRKRILEVLRIKY